MGQERTTPQSLASWARTAHPGDKRVYFVGRLASATDAAELATAAYELQSQGWVNLLQRRLEPDHYEYIAQRRSLGEAAPSASRSAGTRAAVKISKIVPSAPSPRRLARAMSPLDRALGVLEAGLLRDLEQTRARLAQAEPGAPMQAKLRRFEEECEAALRALQADMSQP